MPSTSPPLIVIQKGNSRLTFRKSLFWDIPVNTLDLKKHKRIIIERVFSRGNLEEFKQVINYYSKKEIKNELEKIKNFDKKTNNFIQQFLYLNRKDFYVEN